MALILIFPSSEGVGEQNLFFSKFDLMLWSQINILEARPGVRVFTGSGLITGSDRIGPDRARNWPIPLIN